MKVKTLAPYLLPLFLVVLLLVPHVFFFDNGYVDTEGLYVEAASEIAAHGFAANLAPYFAEIANPVFTSLLLSASYKLFGESHAVSRLTIFLVAFISSLFLYSYLRKKESRGTAFITVLLVTVNPFFIVYSQNVSTDVPFMAFSSIAMLLLLYDSSLRERIISSIMLGISLATKYVTAVLFPVVLIYSFINSRIFSQFSRAKLFHLLRFNLWYFALGLLLSAPVVSITFRFVNGVLAPQQESLLTLNAGMFIPRLFSYLIWLGLFIGPSFMIFVFDLWQRIGKKRLIIVLTGLVALAVVVSLFFPISSLHVQEGDFGEMNLSWIESVIPPLYLSTGLYIVLLIAELFIAGIVFELVQTRDNTIISTILWLIIPVLSLPLTRVANRYMLILLVPLSLYLAFVTKRIFSEGTRLFVVAVLVLHSLIFLSLGFYSNYYLQQRGL